VASAHGNPAPRNQKNEPLPIFTNSLFEARVRIIGGGAYQTCNETKNRNNINNCYQ